MIGFLRRNLGFRKSQASPLADTIFFSKIRRPSTTYNIRTTSLICSMEEFLRVTTCCHVLQGYGLTKTCEWSYVALSDDLSMLGTVGHLYPTTEVHLDSVSEMGYDVFAEVDYKGIDT
jgi:long-chain acyl-CoA synthetase